MQLRHLILPAAAALGVASAAPGQTFTATFDASTDAGDFTIERLGNPSVDLNFDYGGLTFVDGPPPAFPPGQAGPRGGTVPVAPNTIGDSTTAMRIAARTSSSDPVGYAGVLIDSAAIDVGGSDFTMKFDMFMGYNGFTLGGSGSTEFAAYGFNADGAGLVNIGSGAFPGATAAGYQFASSGEGGALADYPVHYTENLDDANYGGFPEPNVEWAAPFEDGVTQRPDNQLNEYYQETVFPDAQTPGSPGKQWVVVELVKSGDEVTLTYDGFLISTLTLADGFADAGELLLGYYDIFASVPGGGSEPAFSDNYVLFDNLSIELMDDVDRLAGDANGDGSVTIADFAILRANFGTSGSSFAMGDFNEDGSVTIADFAILRANFGSSVSSAELAEADAWAATVPEPAALGLLAAAGLSLIRRRR